MEAVNRDLFLASRHCYRRFQTDPADYPQHVDIDQIVADIFPIGIDFVVAFRHVRADEIVHPPCQRQFQSRQQLRRNWNRHLLAGLELLHPDAFQIDVDPVPAQHHAVLQPLAGEHPQQIDHSDLVFIQQPQLRIVEGGQQRLLLFPGEGTPAGGQRLFFPLFAL
ncbi:hypothetical protein SDC9_198771 [bioreactor metagenome]|uniref:Uncharacterized protein n=1 Tax=bioreactor metagenome TaxID=1076179 RepID=A0A645IKY6_9ZZZZ